jgi:hypothetical protein
VLKLPQQNVIAGITRTRRVPAGNGHLLRICDYFVSTFGISCFF